MRYIKINKETIHKLQEYRNISSYFWDIEDIKEFYRKKEYKIYKKYKHLFNNIHIIEKKDKF